VSIEEFETDLQNHLYKLWNRMSSGNYFPPPVRLVEIPKATGGLPPLGIPTVADRVAQMVVKMHLEPLVEPCFHADSYGYRPGKSALDAVATGTRLGGLLRPVLLLGVDPSAQTCGACPDSLATSEVQKVASSRYPGSPLACSDSAARPQPVRFVAGWGKTDDWIIRAGCVARRTSGSARAWGCNSPGLLDQDGSSLIVRPGQLH
jgi:hypothetical protein